MTCHIKQNLHIFFKNKLKLFRLFAAKVHVTELSMKQATLEDFWENAKEKRPREEGLLLI